jgi:hypothetical protein
MNIDSKCAFIQNAAVMRTNYKCSGVKHCEYLDSDIRSAWHTDAEHVLTMIKERRDRDSFADTKERANA